MTIGLTYTGTDWKHDNYVRWLKGDDSGTEVIKLDLGGDVQTLDGVQALVLSGGIDIYPELYGGGMEYPQNHGWKRDRDEFELRMLGKALEQGIPVLGVCRGLQLINVHLKGTLIQDLGVVGDQTHMAGGGADKQHTVTVEEGTLLREIVEAKGGVANSAHHQAVGRLGSGLRVNCRAEDGAIEGLEWADPAGRAFMLAVQWHPERMFASGMADAGLYRAIRDRFIGEIGVAAAFGGKGGAVAGR
jgi:putative glutamine amidotransferase